MKEPLSPNQFRSLLDRYSSGNISPEELEQLVDFINNKTNQLVVDHALREKWISAGEFKLPESLSVRMLNATMERIRKDRRRKVWGAIAASVTILCVAFSYLLLDRTDTIVLTTPINQRDSFALPDGSTVWLQSGSELIYEGNSFGTLERKVTLKGEGFFQVAKSHIPFKVQTSKVTTTVLGTSFNIQAREGDPFFISVASGRVQVDDGINHKLLKRGQRVTYANMFSPVDSSLRTNEFAWREGIFDCNGKSLAEVAVALEHWYGVKVNIANPSASKCMLEGQYVNPNLEDVLEALRFILNIEFTVNQQVVLIQGKGCDNL